MNTMRFKYKKSKSLHEIEKLCHNHILVGFHAVAILNFEMR